ncbi:mannose-1-phosphate guanylyltransferase/mannose-6-phosphate isomerase [Nitrospirillum amazonense]|uniref:mannose-1-phosphate guanylyltransferase n=1 Tax=Nitrospirillum amazonense TaxID=28077 RepID=A0A560JA21_9PROT|nr:mannose-1-phosphate guanylyltransferase/mannose-6-phosphate isomerase [Nitrospirillum amazonense]MDG3442636.1 mannose-1-phosphate guanylyltransferase/mannose-6-phosphate isomerase [Nitrospirillum amazonense]TWB67785.1 mannose-1-phosphate guanylyltransferase/mannose-1-phosphate guanylyltransferase/mannose-6-phosphate isomerase [Nitrospirillum amazonense]
MDIVTIGDNGAGPRGNVAPLGLIQPVLLSGGVGSRLWPLSRERHPKQLQTIYGSKSLIQDTARRVSETSRFASPLIICNEDHRFIIAEQFRDIAIQPAAIILEPVGRNTTPAAAVAALVACDANPDAILLLLPADHAILDQLAFQAAVTNAHRLAAQGNLVTFGIKPQYPETGYGYIQRGAPIEGASDGFHVVAFTEKPDLARAESFIANSDYYWNSGMFMMPARLLIEELRKHSPETLTAVREALDLAKRDSDFLRLDAGAFAKAPNLSIDYAIMEKTDKAAMVTADIGWTDVGTWSALWDISAKDENGNAAVGAVIHVDAKNTYVRCDDGRVAAVVGVDDVILVTTDDAVLLVHRDRAQDVKCVVDTLKREKRTEYLEHRKVHRPWGSSHGLLSGHRYEVKRLSVKPGGKLSLQKHHHRAEHWVVVSGTALVTKDGEELLVRENESVYLPCGSVHRLENPGKLQLELIEVQSGAYLGEDDIVRLDDSYGRS